MLFAPVCLGSTALSAEVLTADVKNCKHFGPCGVGEKALYLNGFLLTGTTMWRWGISAGYSSGSP